MARASREGEIREAALRCFARLGYDATRVKHIAAEAGVSEAALYAHWQSKEALAADIYAEGIRAYAETLRGLAGAAERSVRDRLVAIAGASLELYGTHPDAWTFLIRGQGRFLAALPADFPYPIRVIEALIAEGQADGSVRQGDVRVLAGIATGCFTYPVIVAIFARAGSSSPTGESARRLIANATWDAVAARARLGGAVEVRPVVER
jgi:AcrR family transcriptional regulator